MSKSILQEDKECFITGKIDGLHKHHIFNAANRNISEEQGFWVYLSVPMHTGDDGVHFNMPFAKTLKKMCQMAYEDKCMIELGISRQSARDRFMKMIGRNYL